MPIPFSLTGEFSSCVAVYFEGLEMPRVDWAQRKQCSALNWQWELNPSAASGPQSDMGTEALALSA